MGDILCSSIVPANIVCWYAGWYLSLKFTINFTNRQTLSAQSGINRTRTGVITHSMIKRIHAYNCIELYTHTCAIQCWLYYSSVKAILRPYWFIHTTRTLDTFKPLQYINVGTYITSAWEPALEVGEDNSNKTKGEKNSNPSIWSNQRWLLLTGVYRHAEFNFWASYSPSQGFGNILVQTQDNFCQCSIERKVFG